MLRPQAPIIAVSRPHLDQLIKQSIELNGQTCDLNHIDVSRITDMSGLFDTFRAYNGDISKWETLSVVSMHGMFYNTEFNGDISQWRVSKVGDMTRMFAASAFTGDVSQWDVSNVRSTALMFAFSKFNGDISKWDVTKITSVEMMFDRALFARDISAWTLQSDTVLDGLYDDNPGFLAAQSKVAPWMVGLYIQNQTLPTDPQWAQAFTLVAPVARGLGLGRSEHVEAIVQAYESIVAYSTQREMAVALPDMLVN